MIETVKFWFINQNPIIQKSYHWRTYLFTHSGIPRGSKILDPASRAQDPGSCAVLVEREIHIISCGHLRHELS